MSDVGETISWVGVALGASGVIISALARYAVEQRDKTVDKRLEKVEKHAEESILADQKHQKVLEEEARALTDKLHKQQLEHAKLEGEISVLKKSSETAERDLKDIKDEMVTRKEWLDAQERVESFQQRLEAKIDSLARFSRWSTTPGGMPAVRPREDEALEEHKTPRPTRR